MTELALWTETGRQRLVRDRVLSTGLSAEGWSSEHSSVCRRAELLGRSVKVKKIDLKGRWGLDERLL